MTELPREPCWTNTAVFSGQEYPQHLVSPSALHLPVGCLPHLTERRFPASPNSETPECLVCHQRVTAMPPTPGLGSGREVWGRSFLSPQVGVNLTSAAPKLSALSLCSAASYPCLQSSANHSLGSTLCLQTLCGFCLLAGP